MAWTAPPSFSTGELVPASKLQIISDDLAYLLNRPKGSTFRDNGAAYTTTSTSFTPIDSTNLSHTISMSGGVAIITGMMQTDDNGNNNFIFFDIEVDGVRLGAAGTCGLLANQIGVVAAGDAPITLAAIRTGLSTGSHTFRPVWRVSAGAGRVFSGDGSATLDHITHFGVAEIG